MRQLIVLGVAALFLTQPLVCRAIEGNGDLAVARQLERAFEKVAEQVSPSVVVITCARTIDEEELMQQFEFFFEDRPKPDRKKTPFRHPPVPEESSGSGVLIRADGYILTNHHVVEGAEKITVRLQDDRKFTAKLIGADDRTDLAVIKIEATGLPAAKMADSDKVRVGQWAIAIGAPFQLDYSFTVGFVSGKGRSGLLTRGGTAYEDYIQTDAAINPGNSGGPLVNIEGEVIGINTLIRGLRTNIGFAIPASMASTIADQLITNKRVIRPWLGIEIQSLTEADDLREYLRGPKEGVVVRGVVRNGPAAKSDLRQADIITSVAGKPIRDIRQLQQQVLKSKIGDTIALDVFREGKTLKITVKTAEMPAAMTASAKPRETEKPQTKPFGLSVQDATPDVLKKFELKQGEGVVVTSVEEDSPADQKGLRPGDIITEVDRKPIRTVKEFAAALQKADAKRGVLVYFTRGGSSSFTVLKEAVD